jgi:hypothetical protein
MMLLQRATTASKVCLDFVLYRLQLTLVMPYDSTSAHSLRTSACACSLMHTDVEFWRFAVYY